MSSPDKGVPTLLSARPPTRESDLRYRGILELDAARRDGGLAVELAVSDRALVVTSDGETLGSYPIDQIEVSRLDSDRFDLRVGDDQLIFTAEDAIRFSYEAMPMIQSLRGHHIGHPVDRVVAWWRRRNEVDPTPAAAVSVFTETPAGRAFTASENKVPLSAMRQRVDAARRGDGDAAGSPLRVDGPPTGRSMSTDDVTAEPPPEPVSGLTCLGIRSDGKICGSAAVSPRGFCFAHDPDRHVERREVREQTTKAADRVRRAPAENLDDVVARLERAVAEVHEGKLDPQQAMAMAAVAHAMVETIELAKSQEAEKDRA
ncbi:MAG TPA: hypothetical protein VMS74_08405 [Acidimicrobiia bacterium]|nr:hypothetical protein [Acidimicrobiia bacterium]